MESQAYQGARDATVSKRAIVVSVSAHKADSSLDSAIPFYHAVRFGQEMQSRTVKEASMR